MMGGGGGRAPIVAGGCNDARARDCEDAHDGGGDDAHAGGSDSMVFCGGTTDGASPAAIGYGTLFPLPTDPLGGGTGDGSGTLSFVKASEMHQQAGGLVQMRRGPGHGRGGRKRGSVRKTEVNFGTGLRRALGSYFEHATSETKARDCGIHINVANGSIARMEEWASLTGREEVWLIPGVFGLVGRWGAWRRDESGECVSACVWLGGDGHVRCTCVGSDVFRDDCMYDRRTTCKHATIFDGALEELCGVMQQPVAVVKQHLLSNNADMTASSAMAFRAVGGLYVTMCSHLCSPLPVPQ